jgi:hypothetical protein
MKRILFVFAVVLAAVVPASASGVWGGTPDNDPSSPVGAMYFDFAGTGMPVADGLVCSGSHAGVSADGRNDVFLLAGHCLPPAELGIPADALYVSFDPNAANGVSGSIQVVSYHQMPGFGHDRGDFRDLGILLLPLGSVPGIVGTVELAPEGFLDGLKRDGTLNKRIVDIVGYGAQPDWDSKGPTSFALDGQRRAGTSIITGLGKGFVKMQQNNGIGTGSGLCFGDSGSPQIDRATQRVISVTTGGNGQCNSYNINYRVDTPQARAFLGQFLALP